MAARGAMPRCMRRRAVHEYRAWVRPANSPNSKPWIRSDRRMAYGYRDTAYFFLKIRTALAGKVG